MTRLLVFLADLCADLSIAAENAAIGRRTVRAYRRALKLGDAASVRAAKERIDESSRRLHGIHAPSAAATLHRMRVQLDHFSKSPAT